MEELTITATNVVNCSQTSIYVISTRQVELHVGIDMFHNLLSVWRYTDLLAFTYVVCNSVNFFFCIYWPIILKK